MFISNVDDEEITNFYKIVSKNVKKYRNEKGMTQLELALTIGQKGNAFYNYAENNTNGKHFNLEHLYKIAKALDMPIEDFFKDIKN
ncbi:helix-turn-helix transcriptional regulator [Aliarcobacter cryaerophilus]|uniref:helix-turn-helix transcriptional regulator n=1 Tax=Aliarcobacter cryaerophilus TaxID=28198 RepID=UPI000826F2F5|nr:helix-turn-helix transcriptional regulator [Aliarcobacter cryaerophilus]